MRSCWRSSPIGGSAPRSSPSIVQDRLREHVMALVGERHPVSSPATLAQADQYLVDQFRSLGLIVTGHPFAAYGRTFRNVIATLTGTDASAAPLLIAAHYDTVIGSPGADDNASGLAVLLETARSLKHRPLIHDVQFIGFCLEEENLLGSRAYAAHLRTTNQPIQGMIALECMGYASAEPGSQRIPPGVPIPVPTTGDFLGVIGNEAAAHLVTALAQAAKGLVPELKTVPLLVPGRGEQLPDSRRSDHAAFWDEDYPAVMLTDTADFRNPHYHRPTDTIETLDFAFMELVVDCLAAATVRLATIKEQPAP
ncbi:MAG: M28 family peptidase [Nitrospirae bacterium]|nr:MAG: M28 family peptidase [Nitrospirota bacterium]